MLQKKYSRTDLHDKRVLKKALKLAFLKVHPDKNVTKSAAIRGFRTELFKILKSRADKYFM